MASWVCRRDGTVFTVGASSCPSCQARDAFEQGGDEDLNVYDAVAVTGIASPGDAWGLVNEGVSEAIHQLRREGRETVPAGEARSLVMANQGWAEVDERLGAVNATFRPQGEDTPGDDQDKSTSEVGQDDVSS